jgi:hypothetical protein
MDCKLNRIIMLNTPELPVVGTLYFQVMKFMSAFQTHGFILEEARSIEQLAALSPGQRDIIYVSDHGLSINLGAVQSAFEKMHWIDSTFILWFYHTHIDKIRLPKRWILTGEHFRKKPAVAEHIERWNIQQKFENYVPMTFATAIRPENIGMYGRNEVLRASFVGAPYQIGWCQSLVNSDDKVLIRYTPPFISEEDRIKIYLASVVSLGFHSDNNAKNSVLVERVFEGLALGNVVISDNPICEEFTDGNVKYVSSLSEVQEQIERVWKNPDERKARQDLGMKWCRDNGTYVNVSKAFIEKARILWGFK